MPQIQVLPKEISELIAAGEVVERPASAVKEMLENSLDAGANHITVEIERGGISYIRITDDGCGIERDDVKTAFLRHATSKIRNRNDLDGIKTLGFRGEALASLAAVSKIELITRAKGEEYGTHYIIEGGNEVLCEDSGCPVGTTIIIRDLFYNTPARMKFLKKDSTEGSAAAEVVSRYAISNPQISFKFIRDSKQVFATPKSGDLKSAIYGVLGREYAKNLIEVKGTDSAVKVSGYCCVPFACRGSRAGQYTYLNRRLVISKTVIAAVEQAYKNSVMTGKFPAFVLFIDMPYEAVDVNVHPAKTEVRFADEKAVFSAVYSAIKSALAGSEARPEINLQPQKSTIFTATSDTNRFRQSAADIQYQPKKVVNPEFNSSRLNDDSIPFFLRKEFVKTTQKAENHSIKPQVSDDIILIGEAFRTYIIVQKGESVFILDKHACHERIIFNRLKSETKIESQPLLVPVTVTLSSKQYSEMLENAKALYDAGIEIEDFGNGAVIVRAVPAALSKEDVEDIITETAGKLSSGFEGDLSLIDGILHTVACKAATKAGYISSDDELLTLAKQVFASNDVLYCPHGRPVAIELKKSELEKRFGRIQ